MNNKPQKIEQTQEKEIEFSYEPFDPGVELKELKKYDKETRAERLEEYKKELIEQKQGIAEIQLDLEKQIRDNPELDQQELMKTVFAKAPEYRLSENQLDLFKETLNKYTEKHQAVRETRKKYPDDKKLFEACFGEKPKGVIEVIEGPMTLYFRCHNLKDYTWIFFNKFLLSKDKQKLTQSDVLTAIGTGGCLVSKCLILSLENVIIVENLALRPEDLSIGKIFKHEEQHVIKRLFKEQKIRNFIDDLPTKKEIQDKIIKEFKKKSPKILTEHLRSERENFENMAKDEILALYKPGNFSFQAIKDLLLKSRFEGGFYDYYGKNKEDLINTLEKRITPKIFNKNKKAIKKALNQVFMDEYQQEIIKAINAMEELEKIGKSRSEIIYLLITEPLSRWEKLVKRIKKVKK